MFDVTQLSLPTRRRSRLCVAGGALSGAGRILLIAGLLASVQSGLAEPGEKSHRVASDPSIEADGQWHAVSETGEIRGLADGSRIVRRGDVVVVDDGRVHNTLTTSDDLVYELGADGSPIPVVTKPTPPPDPAKTVPWSVSLFQRLKSSGAGHITKFVSESRGLKEGLVFTFQVGLRVFAAMILLESLCGWIDVSYSKFGMFRVCLAFVLAAEIAFRVLPTVSWSG